MDKYKIALCQMNVCDDKSKNISHALDMIREAASNNADIVILPEMFNCPYQNDCFPVYAEEYPGITTDALSKAALENNVYLVGGSIPEKEDDKIFNTSFIFGRDGKLLGRHRKMHLFDIDVEGGVSFKESDTLTAGNDITVIDTEFGKIGVAICYDIRFPELSRLISLEGAELIILPAAFNMTTGPAHWDISIRMRALDNQVYFAAAAPARNTDASYVAYGNSRVSDPWGRIIAAADENECILYADIERALINSVRGELPLLKHRRTDLYSVNFF